MEKEAQVKPEGTEATSSTSAAPAERARVALTDGRGGILGVKAGMTQVYNDKGEVLAVTVIDLKPNVITQVKTKEKDGYQAIQVGVLEKKLKHSKKSDQGHCRPVGISGFYRLHEFRLSDGAKLDQLTVGKVLSPEFVKPGDTVDLTSRSKGKGFQGGMKRFHMAGGYKSHGASVSHRQLGSIGNRADPGKCFKNKKMPGHMGDERVTVSNVEVVRVDIENQLLLVHGSVPGPRSGIVMVRRSVKNLG